MCFPVNDQQKHVEIFTKAAYCGFHVGFFLHWQFLTRKERKRVRTHTGGSLTLMCVCVCDSGS